MSLKVWLPRVFAFSFLAVSVWFLAHTFLSLTNKNAVLNLIADNMVVIAGCSLVYFFGSLLNAYGFSRLFPEWRPYQDKIVVIYLRTMIGKYIPGNVGHFMGRHFYLKKLELSHKNLIHSHASDLGSSVLGVGVLLIPFFALSNAMDFVFPPLKDPTVKYPLVVLAVLLLAIVPRLIDRLSPKYSYLAAPVFRGLLPYAGAIFVFSLSFALWTSLSFAHSANFEAYAAMIFAYLIAWLLGFITIGAPGGIGVREATLVFVLGPLYGNEAILALALGHRIVAVLGELIGFAGASFLIKGYKFSLSKRSPQGQQRKQP